MEQSSCEMSTEIPSLFTLNDDCLREIDKFLQLDDFVDLAVTCSRLLYVAQQCKKYKTIKVTKYGTRSSCTIPEFAKILAVIGGNVTSVDVGDDTFDILKTIADTNSGIAELDSYYSGQIDGQKERHKLKLLQGLLPFRNLKKLQFGWNNDLSTDEWRNFFESNLGIETLEYEDWGRNKCLPHLQMLPELKSLKINNLKSNPEEFQHLTCLIRLTKFSFGSNSTCNQLLIELAEKLNLMELEFTMPCDADTIDIVQYFRHLEVLSMHNFNYDFCRVPATAIFPKMLKKIKLYACEISGSAFLSIAKQLTQLEEFDIGYCGKIVWDNDDADHSYSPGDIQSSNIFSRIAKELQKEKRKVKLILCYGRSWPNQVYNYSDNLEIINNWLCVQRTFDHIFRLQ